MMWKWIKIKFSNLYLKIRRLYVRNPLRSNRDYLYEVAIAAIFQNEAPYLKEWIEFHKLMGVQHFYLFNHLSTDHYLEILSLYIKKGEVELIEWPHPQTESEQWNQIQCQAYDHAMQLAKGKAKWVAILDVDEFLFPVHENSLPCFLKNYEEFAGVGVNWQLFGSSGLSTIPQEKLLIETLVWKAAEHYEENKHIKSIVRPETVVKCISPHFVIYKVGFYQVSANKKRFTGPFSSDVAVDKIRINHYWSREENYFYSSKVKRRQSLMNESAQKTYQRFQDLNNELDHTILRVVRALKIYR